MPEKIVEIPEGVEVVKERNTLVLKGPKGEIKRDFFNPDIKIEKKDNTIKISTDSERRKDKALLGTWRSHIQNMATGVSKGYEAKLKIVYSHFPMKFIVKGEEIHIENFLGERKTRVCKIIPGSEVKNEKDIVIVTGIDKEIVGQTAANIETLSKVKGFDKRVFQDGIYLIEKTHPVE